MPAPKPSLQEGTAKPNTEIKMEDASLQQQLQSIDWDSERQLISSLAKLQELESKIHELRTLLPDRLLAPLNPIVNPRRTNPSSSIPRNPQILNAQLRKAATEGVAEVNSFKDLWLSSDMQAVWARVNQKLDENKGAFPQPSGIWRRDYDSMLKQMEEEEEEANDNEKSNAMAQPDSSERTQQQQSAFSAAVYGSAEQLEREGGWKSVIESFQNRQIPGFRVSSSKNESMIVVTLGLAGILLEIQEVLTTNTATSDPSATTPTPASGAKQNLPEWRVSSRQSFGKAGPSRLETAIVQQLNSWPRKWDLHYLLELILAYSDVQSKPCNKCNRLTDSSAQLPIIRRLAPANTPAPIDTTNNVNADNQISTTAPSEVNTSAASETGIRWEAYHTECV